MTLAEIENLRADLAELERRAGISEQIEDAKLGPLIPNTEGTSTEYWDDVDDYARRKTRKLYFSVTDLELRKALIKKSRACGRASAVYAESELAKGHRELALAQRRSHSLPWFGAGVAAAVCVAAGAYVLQMYGAIGGALIGFFVGQGVIANARTEREFAVRQAQAEVKELEEAVHENELTPGFFNAEEECTGECDSSFNYESVIANRAQKAREAT